MITGKLVKFEPTQDGVTIMVKVSKAQIREVVDLYDQDVEIAMPSGSVVEREYPTVVVDGVQYAPVVATTLLD